MLTEVSSVFYEGLREKSLSTQGTAAERMNWAIVKHRHIHLPRVVKGSG